MTNLSPERQYAMLRRMITIRRFEEIASEKFRAGDIYGVVHAYSGEEAGADTKAWQGGLGNGHGFLGFADVLAQENVEDITFTWDRQVNDRNSFHLAYHMFSLESATDQASLLGGGLPGWAGAAAGAGTADANGNLDDDLGNELDLVWKHTLSNDVSLALGYAAFDAGDYFTANNAGANSPDVTYTWLNATVKF